MKLLMCCCWRVARCWLRFSRTGAIVLGVCLGGESICSVGFAQETLEELLEIAGPHWERQRKQNYEQLAIRIEEFKDHRGKELNQNRRMRESRDYFADCAAKLIRRSGSSTVNPVDLFCSQIRNVMGEQHGIGEQHGGKIVQRVDADGKRVAAITFRFNRELNSARLPDSEKDAVRYLTKIKIKLLPDQDWQLLYYEMRNDLLNDSEQTIRTYRWSTQFDYTPSDLKWLYRVTDTEDATLGVIKTNRFIRPLTDDEKAELRPLCRLSGFGLPEPES